MRSGPNSAAHCAYPAFAAAGAAAPVACCCGPRGGGGGGIVLWAPMLRRRSASLRFNHRLLFGTSAPIHGAAADGAQSTKKLAESVVEKRRVSLDWNALVRRAGHSTGQNHNALDERRLPSADSLSFLANLLWLADGRRQSGQSLETDC